MNQEAITTQYLIGKWPFHGRVLDVVRSSRFGELLSFCLNADEGEAMEKLRSIFFSEGQFRARAVLTMSESESAILYDDDVIVRHVAPNTDNLNRIQLRLVPETLHDESFLWECQDAFMVLALVQINDDESPVHQGKKEVVEKAHRSRQMKLSNVAHMLCTNPRFWAFLTARYGKRIHDVFQAKTMVYRECRIDSCSRLDHEPDAARAFHSRLRKPYLNWIGAN